MRRYIRLCADQLTDQDGSDMVLRENTPILTNFTYRQFILLVLTVATLIVYWQVQYYDFIGYDDPSYVTSNRHVQSGLTSEGIQWAAKTMELSNWHPLTWLSHMVDCELFGLNPMGHHWTNLLFHLLNIILLFYVMHRFTGELWKSALLAVFFALHPLNVESVAWISERKNVLSTSFWIMTMMAYGYYVIRPNWKRYVLIPVAFALGIMAKPMLVTLPFVLLLMDFWPLCRMRFSPYEQVEKKDVEQWIPEDKGKALFSWLLIEKIPLFLITFFSIVMTLKTSAGQAMAKTEILPELLRIENAVISYVRYIGKFMWPEKLAVLYPYNFSWPLWQVAGACVLLGCFTIFVIRKSKTHPYLAVGWFWYLGTLIPVIGLVQVGMQAMADRYMYVPMIGILIMLMWGIHDLFKRWRVGRTIQIVTSFMVIILLMVCTHIQIQYWQNSVRLFRHAVSVTSGNYVAHNILGNDLRSAGHFEEAIANYQRAIAANTDFWPAYNNNGVALSAQGKYDEAIQNYSMAIALYKKAAKIGGDYATVHFNLGDAFFHVNRINEAALQFEEAVRIRPEVAAFRNSLGVALIRLGRNNEAARQFLQALQLDPEHAGAHHNLAMILSHQGNFQEAIAHFSEALRIQPKYSEARRNMQEVLKKISDLQEKRQRPNEG